MPSSSAALNPAQQVIKIVHDELVATLGGETIKITFASQPPTVVLMAGLQGSGKTTSSAKLARWFKSQGRNPMMVGADLQRPAAIEQLRTLGRQIDVPVHSIDPDHIGGEGGDPVEVARGAVTEARRIGKDVVIVDTAGRLAIDAELMDEVRRISEATTPDYTFLVVDAMTGQDAVTVAENFNDTLALDGVILTKLDGDARGGAALSVKEVVGKPIAFAATGEKIDDFDLFHPDRLAGRILGMGDVMTLIEKAEEVFEEQEAEAAAQKLMDGDFTLDDFLDQLQQVKKMGSMSSLLAMMPGVPKEMRNARDRRLGDRADRRDHQVDDGRRANSSGDHRRFTPSSHRRRFGHRSRCRRRAHQPVQRGPEDDEEPAWVRQPGKAQEEEVEEGQTGRSDHAEGHLARCQDPLRPPRSPSRSWRRRHRQQRLGLN